MSKKIKIEKPLVSFVIFGYNHEKYIIDAIHGAFSQTYSPLEIIISDDFSSDKTFYYMKTEVEKYKGSHKVVLRKNYKNLGTNLHINEVLKIANGELLIFAAGDDISVPERTEKIVQKWLDSGREKYVCLASNYYYYDDATQKKFFKKEREDAIVLLSDYFAKKMNLSLMRGATGAYTRELLQIRELPYGLVEDRVLSFRALLLGKILYIEEPLVLYRVHENSFSGKYNKSNSVYFQNFIREMIVSDLIILEEYLLFSSKIKNKELKIILSHINQLTNLIDFGQRGLIGKVHAFQSYPPFSNIKDKLFFWLNYYELQDSYIYSFLRKVKSFF